MISFEFVLYVVFFFWSARYCRGPEDGVLSLNLYYVLFVCLPDIAEALKMECLVCICIICCLPDIAEALKMECLVCICIMCCLFVYQILQKP